MRLFRTVGATVVVFSSSALLFAQTPANRPQTRAKPEFEVASIKAAAPLPTLIAQIKSRQVRAGMSVSGNRFDCLMSLHEQACSIGLGVLGGDPFGARLRRCRVRTGL